MSYKKKLSVLVGVSLLALVGCSHSNPLQQYSHETVASDLLSAAVSAELKLGLAKKTYQAGPYYFACMEGKQKKECQSVYQWMVKKLRPKYKGLTMADLSDKRLWSFVKGFYQEDMFNRLPE